MNGVQFKAWRQWMGWSQQQTAEHLGLGRRTIMLYENTRDTRKLPVPRAVELACEALARGIRKYEERL